MQMYAGLREHGDKILQFFKNECLEIELKINRININNIY